MTVKPPRLPQELIPIAGGEDLANALAEGEGELRGRALAGLRLSGPEGVDLREAALTGCSLAGGALHRASFVDVSFTDCDLAGADLTNAYFSRCAFTGCRLTGVNLAGAALSHLRLTNCTLSYANLDGARLTAVRLERCDLAHAQMTGCALKDLSSQGSRFIAVNFFRTRLKGVDFTHSELAGLQVSDRFEELAGAVVSPEQAAELAKLMGLVVR